MRSDGDGIGRAWATASDATATLVAIGDFLARTRSTGAALRARLLAEPSESDPPAVLVREALDELSVTQEELAVADEQLRTSHEELARIVREKEAEVALYQEHFDHSPDGFAVTDARGTMRQVNAPMGELLNTLPRFLVDKPLLHFVSRADCAAFRRALSRLVAQGRIDGVMVRLRPRRTGAMFHAELHARYDRSRGIARWTVRNVSSRVEEMARLGRTTTTADGGEAPGGAPIGEPEDRGSE